VLLLGRRAAADPDPDPCPDHARRSAPLEP
jgi:hypothetical protein